MRKVKMKSWRDDQFKLDTLVLPHWRHRLAKSITRRDVRDLIDGIALRGPIQANRTRALLSKIFNVGIQQDMLDTNPVQHTAKRGVEQRRDRVLSEDEIRQFWTATTNVDLSLRAAFQLRLLTAQRGGEVLTMRVGGPGSRQRLVDDSRRVLEKQTPA